MFSNAATYPAPAPAPALALGGALWSIRTNRLGGFHQQIYPATDYLAIGIGVVKGVLRMEADGSNALMDCCN